MNRRNVLFQFCALVGGCFSWVFTGCRRAVDPIPGYGDASFERESRDMNDVIDFARRRVLQEIPAQPGSRFAIAVLSVIGFVLQVIQFCKATNVMKQHAAIKRRPDGAVAKRVKSQLHQKYVEQHPDASSADADEYVRASVAAFAKASPQEIERLHGDLQRLQDSPTPIDLFEFSESLAR